jgi:hypothetical protein
MISLKTTLSLFVLTCGLAVSASGCSEIAEAIDCNQMCSQIERCIDDDLDVQDCAERCEDRVADNTLADKLDACTDCLDRGYSCSEVNDECSVCDEVQIALEG